MKSKLLVGIVAALAVYGGIQWWKSSRTTEPLDKAAVEQELKKEGVMNSDGTIKADAEFDAELNALNKELNAAEGDSGTELDVIDAIQ